MVVKMQFIQSHKLNKIILNITLLIFLSSGTCFDICAQNVVITKYKNSKIAIVSLFNAQYKHIGQYSDFNKTSYAKRHKYDLILYHDLLDLKRPAPWNKIPAIQNHLNDYEWIMWSDADSLIMNQDINIESLIDNNYDLIITREANDKHINTGQFLIKNSSWSRQLLHDIYAQTQFINASGWWEQAALAHLLTTNKSLYKKIKILPQRTMNSHPVEKGGEYIDGDFIIHFYWPHLDKAKLMKEYYYKSLEQEINKSTNLSLENFNKILNHVEALEQMFVGAWQSYYSVMSKLITQFSLKKGCEIGVAFGTHSEYMLKNTLVEKLYSIDPYQHFNLNYDDPMNLSQDAFNVLHYKVRKRLSIFGSRSIFIRKKSVAASYMFSKESLDFVFIDANHSYSGIMEDLNAWYNKVRAGGILAGDDYSSEFPGVIQGVNEFFAHKNIKLNQDYDHPRIWWIQKP